MYFKNAYLSTIKLSIFFSIDNIIQMIIIIHLE